MSAGGGIHPNGEQGTRRVVTMVVFGVASLILIAHAARYLPFISDDALISLRYAQRLLNGHGLTWTDGPPVEGYSNLLWTLLVAVVGWFSVDLITAARALGLACAIVTIAVLLRAHHGREPLPALVAGALFLAFAGPMAVWAIGGLEQALLAALMASWLMFTSRLVMGDSPRAYDLGGASLTLAALCLTRPDGPLFTAITVVVVALFARRANFRAGAYVRLLVAPALAVVAQFAFRHWYYGAWWPNTAYIKLNPTSHYLSEGVAYLAGGFVAMGPLGWFAVVFLVWLAARERTRPAAVLLLATVMTWSAYLVVIGGDIFPAWRHFIPLVVPMAFALTMGVGEWWRLRAERIVRAATVVVMAALLAAFAARQYRDPHNRLALEERWEWDGRVVGEMLRHAFGDSQAVLACTAAGCLPYWSQLPAVDMLGLNDRHIARASNSVSGTGDLGHEAGDGAYVLSREPDLISFCGPLGAIEACYKSGKEMQIDPLFKQRYSLVRLRGDVPHSVTSIFWAWLQSPRIGMRVVNGEIVIPAFFFTTSRGSVAYLRGNNQLLVDVTPERPISLSMGALQQGTWRGRARLYGIGNAPVAVRRTSTGTVVEVSTSEPGGVSVESVTLWREGN